ncbi:MAG: PEP/pyruvate-binding domain-containing protein [bacterium]
MLGNPKKYVLTFSQVGEDDLELVGEKILRLRRAEQAGINLPLGFAITSTAFDDFLTANDLVDYIAPRINEVDLEDLHQAKKSGEDIQQAIRAGTIPEIVLKPIIQAYNNLSGFTKSFVRLRTSFPTIVIDETHYGQENIQDTVSGEAMLVAGIKEMWASLFAPVALNFRSKINYEGYLTSALLVQKMVQAEISGSVFSVAPVGNDIDQIEITAVYGNYLREKAEEFIPDSYLGSKKSEEIIEKHVVDQEYMYVRKHNHKGNDANLKVTLSSAWRKKQKLDDKYVINLIRITKILEEIFKHPQEVDYVLEGGKIFLYNFQTIKDLNIAWKSQMQRITDKIAAKALISKAEEEQKNLTPKPEKKDVTELVAEIKAEVALPAKISDDSLLETQVTTTLEPLASLTKIILAKGTGKDLTYGLLHFIYTLNDWLDLTGDEILAVDQIDPQKIPEINKARGIIISGVLDSIQLESITVPVISEADQVFRLLHENEVVTLDPVTGTIYLGAGKRNVQQDESVRVEPKQSSQPSIQMDQASEVSPFRTDTSISEKSTPDKLSTFKFAPIKIKQSNKLIHQNTITDLIQFVDLAHPEVDPALVHGLFLELTDVFKYYQIDPQILFESSRQKRNFIEEFVVLITDIAEKMKTKYIIINSADIDFLRKHFDRNDMSKASLMQIELELISVLRNRENLRNIWYGLTNVENNLEQIEQKKNINAFGLRRTATFKIVTNLQYLLPALTVKRLVADGTDAILIDIDALLHLIYAGATEAKEIDQEVLDFIGWIVHIVNHNKTKLYLKTENYLFSKAMVEQLLEKGQLIIIAKEEQLATLRPIIVESEQQKIEKKKKRGRKKKMIDYGF